MKDIYLKEMLFSHDQIVERCKELGKWVDDTYKDSKNLVLVGLLKGSIPFMAELIKHVKVEHTLDFLVVSSYNGGIRSSGNLKIVMDLSGDIKGADVLIVEDIVDSGHTLTEITKRFKNNNVNTVKTLTLLDKKEGRKIPFKPDMIGFDIQNQFVYGFGLDVKEKLRNIPYIGVFDIDKINKL